MTTCLLRRDFFVSIEHGVSTTCINFIQRPHIRTGANPGFRTTAKGGARF